MNNFSIAIAADHAGVQLKKEIKDWLISKNYLVEDFGTNSEESVDYPDFAKLAVKNIQNKKSTFGVLICGSGIGMCMAANHQKGIRAVILKDKNDAKLSRAHNNANVACFGARFMDSKSAIFLLDIFLNTEFEGGRHDRRVQKID